MALAALCTTMVFASSAEKQESDDSLSLDGLRKIVQRFASEFQVDPDDEAQQNDPRNFTLQQLAREWMLNSRVEGLRINRSILRIEGAVSGYGLFATRDIEPGELISCYPGDVLMYHPTDGILFGGHVPKSIREVELVDELEKWGSEGMGGSVPWGADWIVVMGHQSRPLSIWVDTWRCLCPSSSLRAVSS